MAALALLALVGKASEFRILLDLLDTWLWHHLELGRELVTMGLDHGFHVLLVFRCADDGYRAIRVCDIVVAPGDLVILDLVDSPGMQIALDLARLGVHERPFDTIDVVGVTHAAGIFRNPDTAGIGIELLRTGGHPIGNTLVGLILVIRDFGITAVADNTAFRITVASTHRLDLLHHGAGRVPDILDAFMTRKTSLCCRNGIGNKQCQQDDRQREETWIFHGGTRVFGVVLILPGQIEAMHRLPLTLVHISLMLSRLIDAN